MSSAILTANLPILVPPNFCTIHFAEGSMLFWCKLGGVPGGGVEAGDMEVEGLGVEGMSDIVCDAVESFEAGLYGTMIVQRVE